MIEPEGGELNYDLARTNPLSFYDQVMTQNVTETKARDTRSPTGKKHLVQVSQKQTHRKVGRILLLVQSQLVEFLKGKWSRAQLQAALKDRRVNKVVQKHLLKENIQLMH